MKFKRGDQVETVIRVNGTSETRRGQIETVGTVTANVLLEGRSKPTLVTISELKKVGRA